MNPIYFQNSFIEEFLTDRVFPTSFSYGLCSHTTSFIITNFSPQPPLHNSIICLKNGYPTIPSLTPHPPFLQIMYNKIQVVQFPCSHILLNNIIPHIIPKNLSPCLMKNLPQNKYLYLLLVIFNVSTYSIHEPPPCH